MRRLGHQDPHVALQAAVLLDACINNCGKRFLLEVASRDFENEFRRILTRAQPAVQTRLRALLRRWAEGEFRTDPQLDLVPSLYAKLRQEGHDFNMPEIEKESRPPTTTTPAANTAAREQEELARAIALSLQEANSGGGTGGNSSSTGGSSLYPSVDLTNIPAVASSGSANNTTATTTTSTASHQQVRALYDFEAAEDNELTFLAGEISEYVLYYCILVFRPSVRQESYL